MIDQLNVIALIPARGGSKGIPRKNVRDLHGMPLISYSIKAAKGSKYIDRVVVTTDDAEIADVSKRFGADVPFMRPDELAADTSKTIDCVVHARDWFSEHGFPCDVIVLLQPTSPLRTCADIDSALECFLSHGCLGLCSVSLAEQNPLLLRTIGEGGVLHPLVNQSSTMRRQDLPCYYKVNGSIYINLAKSLSLKSSLNDNPVGYVVDTKHAIDIDTYEDFLAAEKALSKES